MRSSRRRFLKTSVLAAAAVPLAAGKAGPVVSIDGPLISTGDIKRQRDLFEGVFGLVPVADQALSAAEVGRLWDVKGPDGVTCAFVRFHDSPRERFVRVTDGLFSEILGVSAPVADLAAVTAFYRALGLGVVFKYGDRDRELPEAGWHGREDPRHGDELRPLGEGAPHGVVHHLVQA